MTTPKNRASVHAYVTPEARDTLQTFAEGNGVSVTGLLESLFEDLHEEMTSAGHVEVRDEWVRKARGIDARHRRRG